MKLRPALTGNKFIFKIIEAMLIVVIGLCKAIRAEAISNLDEKNRKK